MNYALCPPLRVPEGDALAGGSMETYLAGTSTPLATYADNVGTANPTTVPLNASGRPNGAVYLATTDAVGFPVAYKFIVKDSGGATVYTQDEVRAGGLQLFDLGGTVNLSDSSTLQDAVDAIGANQRTLVVSTDFPVAADTLIPANVSLLFVGEGRLSPAGGVTLTVNGAIVPVDWQIFGTSGTVVFGPQVRQADPRWWGAVGDGLADDTTAFQKAIATGRLVYVPPTAAEWLVSATLVMATDGQGMSGVGPASKIRQSLANGNVLNVTGDDVTLYNFHIECSPTRSSTFNGCGIYANGVSRTSVRDLLVTGGRSWGVLFRDVTDGDVGFCRFVDSVVQDTDDWTQAGGDILFCYSTIRCRAHHNRCVSGNGAAVYVQSIGASSTLNDNVVESNLIDGYRAYGIIVYRNNLADDVFRNTVRGNLVQNISGALLDSLGQHNFGAGIYVQGGEYTKIIGNRIRNTNTATVDDTLAPGAIGATNCTVIDVENNTIIDPQWYGITLRDPNQQGIADGCARVNGNTIIGAVKTAFQILQRGDIYVDGLLIQGGATHGVLTSQAAPFARVTLKNITVKDCGGTALNLQYVNDLVVSGAVIFAPTDHGIAVYNCARFTVDGCEVKDAGVRGFDIDGTSSVGAVSNCRAMGCAFGFRAESASTPFVNCSAVNSTSADWVGTYARSVVQSENGSQVGAGSLVGYTAITVDGTEYVAPYYAKS